MRASVSEQMCVFVCVCTARGAGNRTVRPDGSADVLELLEHQHLPAAAALAYTIAY